MSKVIMPLPSVEGLGAGVTSRVPTLTRLMGTKDLKPSPLTVMVEPGPPLVSDRVIIPSGTSWATVVTTLTPIVIVPRRKPLWNCWRGWQPWWECAAESQTAAGIRRRRNRGGVAIAGIVHDLDIEAAALVVLAGEAFATYHRDGAHAARLRGNGHGTSGNGLRSTTPVRPRESVIRMARSPSAVVASLKGQVHRGGPVAAVVHPHRVAVIDPAGSIVSPPMVTHRDPATPPSSSHWRLRGLGLNPVPTRLIRWLASTVPGVTLICGPTR